MFLIFEDLFCLRPIFFHILLEIEEHFLRWFSLVDIQFTEVRFFPASVLVLRQPVVD